MPNEITLEIDGKSEPFNIIWIHLQRVRETSVDFRVRVAQELLRPVFDPYETKETHQSWRAFILKAVAELGSFAVEGYFRTMAKAAGQEKGTYRWVIASIDDIAENSLGLEIVGRAVPFVPRG